MNIRRLFGNLITVCQQQIRQCCCSLNPIKLMLIIPLTILLIILEVIKGKKEIEMIEFKQESVVTNESRIISDTRNSSDQQQQNQEQENHQSQGQQENKSEIQNQQDFKNESSLIDQKEQYREQQLNKQIKEKENHILGLNQKIEELVRKIQESSQQIAFLQNAKTIQIEEFQRQLLESKTIIEEKDSAIKEFENQNQIQTNKIQHLEQANLVLEETIKVQNIQTQHQVQQLTKQIEVKKNDIIGLNSKIEQLQKNIEESCQQFKTILEEKDSAIKEFENQNQIQTNKIQHLEQANLVLEETIKVQNIKTQQNDISEGGQIQNEKKNVINNGKQEVDKNQALEEALAKTEQIYSKSYKNRQVPPELKNFIGVPQDFNELVKYYFGGQKSNYKEAINQMKQELTGYRRIRGDGNCFYTAFTYQYFTLLLKDAQRREEFLQQINNLLVSITYQDIKIENNTQLVKEFIRQFSQLQNEEQLFELMRDYDLNFYGLSIMVMRNYIVLIYRGSNDLYQMGGQEYLVQNLLTWEEECNSNEIIISALASHLKLIVIVHYIDKKNKSYDRKQYGEEGQPKLGLLLSPGHYQIGLLL